MKTNKCPQCQGRGETTPGFAYSEWETCDKCNGSGKMTNKIADKETPKRSKQLKDTKIKLYGLLLNKAIEELSKDETDMLYLLGKDPAIQEHLNQYLIK